MQNGTFVQKLKFDKYILPTGKLIVNYKIIKRNAS